MAGTSRPEEGITKNWGSNLNAQLCPSGAVIPFAGSSAPVGWLLCDGTTLTLGGADEIYEDLFNVIGTTYGGTGSSDFKVPNMQGRIPIGVGTGDASDATAHTLGEKEGTETHTLTEAEMPSHRHDLPRYANAVQGGSNTIEYGRGSSSYVGDNLTDETGGDEAHNNLQPSLALNYIIKI